MKARFSIIVGLAAWLLVSMAATLQAQFNYEIHRDGTVIITGYTGPGGHVVIPDRIEGKPVTVIGEGAFRSKTSVLKVTIPDSVHQHWGLGVQGLHGPDERDDWQRRHQNRGGRVRRVHEPDQSDDRR